MPIIKHIAIHKNPMYLLRYVMRGDKTDELKYVSGLNCSADPEAAYDEFRSNFENFAGIRFYKKSVSKKDDDTIKNEKVPIRLHHYIQSFKPGEITPEEAHEIGIEWAKKIFGDNRQVVVSTHVDKGHIHNHFAVAVHGFDGKVWHDNKKTMQMCRNISDKIAKEQGLSVIEKSQYKANHKYGDWLARKTGTSWKTKLCDDIDRLILQDNVKSVEDLTEELCKCGYIAKCGKYLSVKAHKDKKAIRTLRLGDGYGIEELRYRIEHKDHEMTIEEALKYHGIQREYALCLRQIQIMVYRKIDNPYKATYGDVRRNADLLNYLTENKIENLKEFQRKVEAAEEKAALLKSEKKDLSEKIKSEKSCIEKAPRYIELHNKPTLDPKEIAELKKLKKEMPDISSQEDIEEHTRLLYDLQVRYADIEKEYAEAKCTKQEVRNLFDTYVRQIANDYDVLLDAVQEEQERLERLEISEQIQNQSQNQKER